MGYDDDIFPQDVFIYAKHVVFFTVSEGGHNGFMDTEAIHVRRSLASGGVVRVVV